MTNDIYSHWRTGDDPWKGIDEKFPWDPAKLPDRIVKYRVQFIDGEITYTLISDEEFFLLAEKLDGSLPPV